MSVVIPDFETAVANRYVGKTTPIDKFVIENEPAGTREEKKFRKELQDVIDYVAELSSDDLRASLSEAVAMLERLQWHDNHVDRYGKESFACPVCESLQEWDHAPDCELDALLKKYR